MANDALGGNSAKELKSIIDRVENLIEDRKSVNADIKQVLDEADSSGFDKKIIRKVIQRRAVARIIRLEQDALIETYEGIVNTDEE
jgi:uncharacterized protein (UPF0335 family)